MLGNHRKNNWRRASRHITRTDGNSNCFGVSHCTRHTGDTNNCSSASHRTGRILDKRSWTDASRRICMPRVVPSTRWGGLAAAPSLLGVVRVKEPLYIPLTDSGRAVDSLAPPRRRQRDCPKVAAIDQAPDRIRTPPKQRSYLFHRVHLLERGLH